MRIRPETPGDIESISALTAQAFAPMPFSSGTEVNVITALRAAGELTLSLVAELEGALVGQITFSPVTIAGVQDDWYGLGPVAVHPDRQGTKIGSGLIETGLERMRRSGAGGCVLIGDPKYYHRFGFQGDSGLTYKQVPPAYVQQRCLIAPRQKQGEILYAPAFEAAA